jgi:hypothetical protein
MGFSGPPGLYGQAGKFSFCFAFIAFSQDFKYYLPDPFQYDNLIPRPNLHANSKRNLLLSSITA